MSGGCQPDTRDSEEHAPVHLAVIHHQVDCVQSLARSGADLNILDSNRDTALHVSQRTTAKYIASYICIW